MHVSRIHVLVTLSIAALCIAGCLFRGAEAKKSPSPASVGAAAGTTQPGVTSGQKPGELSVDGIATLQVIPNVVDVTMTLTVEQSRPKKAMAKLRNERAQLVAALQSAGVARAQLALSNVNLHPVYHPHPRNHQIRGYEASITLMVELKDFARIAEVMEAGAAAGVHRMSTRFRSTEMPRLKKRVRELAFQAASAKAAQIAGLMNVKLGRVVKLSEGQSGNGWGASPFGNININNNEFVAAPSSQDKILPGAQPLTLTVQVSYEI